MKFPVYLLVVSLALCLCAPPVRAGEDGKAAVVPEPVLAPAAGPTRFNLSGEFDVSESYVGSAEVRRNGRDSSLDEHNSEVRFVLTPRISLGYLRLGVEYQRFSFGFDHNTSLPNTLQSASLVLGLDTKFSDSILVRFEAQPGIYGTFFDHLCRGDFNVPFVAGGTYIYSPDVQFIFGVGVDINRKYPVLPAVGVRWKVAPRLVLDAELPTPRVEYEYNKRTTLYVGAEFKEDNFRLGRRFGDTHGDPKLNRAVVTFSEVRTGVGLTQKLAPSLTLSAEGGCQPFREFDFYRADAGYRSEGVAPYGQISLRGAF